MMTATLPIDGERAHFTWASVHTEIVLFAAFEHEACQA